MAKIFLVDDDQGFLDSFKEVPMDHVEVHTFDKPMNAIRALSKEAPDIIITDIQMPDLHGLNFGFICREIIQPRHLIFISANTLADVEKKFGSLANEVFYKKPLADEFFDDLDKVIASLDKDATRPSHKQRSQDIHQRFDQLNQLQELWNNYQQMLYESAIDHKFMGETSREFKNQISACEQRLQGYRLALDLDLAKWEKLLDQLRESCLSWYERVLDHAPELAARPDFTPEFPCQIESQFTTQKLPDHIKKAELRVQNQQAAIYLNGLPLKPVQKVIESPIEQAKSLLKTIALYDILVNEMKSKIKELINTYWAFDIFRKKEVTLKEVRFDFENPLDIGINNTIDYIILKGMGNIARREVRLHFSDGRVELGDELFRYPEIPRNSTISGHRRITLRHDGNLVIVLCEEGKELPLPSELREGRDTYDQARSLIEYAWSLALNLQLNFSTNQNVQ